MMILLQKKSTGAPPPSLPVRLWILPVLVGCLIAADLFLGGMNSPTTTALAALAIALVGIPHGTLDVEIAARRVGRANGAAKLLIVAAYMGCALLMALCWFLLPELALILFLVISIVHFGQDWRNGADPFLAMMVGWALVGLPALSHPGDVQDIFATLTGSMGGPTISAVLACASVPATLGSLVFAYWAWQNDEAQNAADVISCMIAATFLPPLAAFAVFFCGLHSPRHTADALRESGNISVLHKGAIMVAVFMLSMAIGVLLFVGQPDLEVESGIVRSAFMLISILTAPHFILEHYRPRVTPGLHADPATGT